MEAPDYVGVSEVVGDEPPRTGPARGYKQGVTANAGGAPAELPADEPRSVSVSEIGGDGTLSPRNEHAHLTPGGTVMAGSENNSIQEERLTVISPTSDTRPST